MIFKKIFYTIVNPFRKLYWFIFRPKTFGVKAFIFFQGKVLLIRNTYGIGHWTLPGGGVGRKELPIDAVKREVKEEVGIILDQIKCIGSYESTKQYKRDTVYVFSAQVFSSDFKIDKTEIAEVGWFSLDSLPEFHSHALDKAIKFFRTSQIA